MVEVVVWVLGVGEGGRAYEGVVAVDVGEVEV